MVNPTLKLTNVSCTNPLFATPLFPYSIPKFKPGTEVSVLLIGNPNPKVMPYSLISVLFIDK